MIGDHVSMFTSWGFHWLPMVYQLAVQTEMEVWHIGLQPRLLVKWSNPKDNRDLKDLYLTEER